MVLELLLISLLVSYALLVWFKTDAPMEYMRKVWSFLYFPLPQRVQDYLTIKQDGFDGNFIDFLHEYYNDDFFVRLGSCPICLSFWFGIPFVFFSVQFLAVIPLALLFYLIFVKLI